MQMRQTRHHVVRDVVVTSEDIRSLAAIVEGAANVLDDPSKLYKAHAHDNSDFDGPTPAVFEKGGILETKQIYRVYMLVLGRVRGGGRDSEIQVEIEHDRDCRMSVAGTDITWVNGIMAQIEDATTGWQRQASWPGRLELVVEFASAIGFCYIFVVLWHLIFHVTIPPISADPRWVIGLIVGLIASIVLTKGFLRLWPTVEIRTGKEYAQIARRRKKYAAVFAMVVLPLLLRVLYDGAKALLK